MAEWIPLLQTLVWPVVVIGLVGYFRGTCFSILEAISDRIKSGAPFKAGPIELGSIAKELEKLPSAPQKAPGAVREAEPSDWRHQRAEKYERVNGYMLVHVYRPSSVPNQKYDVFLFIVRHRKGTDGPPRREFEEIEKAEFFFGESWGNEVFAVVNAGGLIGVRTHAWGTFLACCRITFRDKQKQPIVLFRYVDFHMLQDNPHTE